MDLNISANLIPNGNNLILGSSEKTWQKAFIGDVNDFDNDLRVVNRNYLSNNNPGQVQNGNLHIVRLSIAPDYTKDIFEKDIVLLILPVVSSSPYLYDSTTLDIVNSTIQIGEQTYILGEKRNAFFSYGYSNLMSGLCMIITVLDQSQRDGNNNIINFLLTPYTTPSEYNYYYKSS